MTEPRPCRLCSRLAALRSSHIIPAFVFRWLRESSPGPGKLRPLASPNQRIQDGPTEEWLCDDCEQRFSGWEKVFAESVFRYVHSTSEQQKPVVYGDWALRFVLSISWRVLQFFKDKPLHHLTSADKAGFDSAEASWREVLLGERTHPGEFEQHVLLVDALSDASDTPVSPFLNRYLLRTVAFDLVCSRRLCFTYAKLCRILVIGIIRMDSREFGRTTRVSVRSGQFGGDFEIPEGLLHYWNTKADQAASALASLSEKQVNQIDYLFANTDPDLLANSEVFRAMSADVWFSGDAAFRSTGRKPGDQVSDPPGGKRGA